MKKRIARLPRRDKLVKRFQAGGWSYDLYQRPSGNYTLVGVETDGEDWAMVEGDTPKAAMKKCRMTAAEIAAALAEPEAAS